MILFRKKYPAWWAEWNRELLRFSNRIHVYLVLMTDRTQFPDDVIKAAREEAKKAEEKKDEKKPEEKK